MVLPIQNDLQRARVAHPANISSTDCGEVEFLVSVLCVGAFQYAAWMPPAEAFFFGCHEGRNRGSFHLSIAVIIINTISIFRCYKWERAMRNSPWDGNRECIRIAAICPTIMLVANLYAFYVLGNCE